MKLTGHPKFNCIISVFIALFCLKMLNFAAVNQGIQGKLTFIRHDNSLVRAHSIFSSQLLKTKYNCMNISRIPPRLVL